MADIAVLLPVRIETRFKDADLWIRVIPDEPWFLHDDSRITADEILALRRYVASEHDPGLDGIPAAWRTLASRVGAPRAVFLHRRFVVTVPDGSLAVREPEVVERRAEPLFPRISGFPTDLCVWIADQRGLTKVLQLSVKRDRLLFDFPDPNLPSDRRWWEDWDEAVDAGIAGIVPASELGGTIEAMYVTGLGDGDPAEHFGDLVAEGRIGLLEPGTPTNSVDGAPAAHLSGDADSWWQILHSPPAEADTDVSRALTGDGHQLGNMPGGDRPQRSSASGVVTVLWPALWGFAAAQVFDIARGPASARWAADAMFPEGAYPILRIGPQPYGLLPVTSWTAWKAADGDPALEVPLIRGLVLLRQSHVRSARTRGNVAGTTTDELLDIIADTPTSSHFRYRAAWPLELWWLGMVGASVPLRWRSLEQAWSARHPLADELGLRPLRHYGARGRSRRVGIPLVVPAGVEPSDLRILLGRLADAAENDPASFAYTSRLEADILAMPAGSLLVRLAIRSLQVLIGDLQRDIRAASKFDPEPFARDDRERGRLEQLIEAATAIDTGDPRGSVQHLLEVTTALRSLGEIPVPALERMLAATIDCSSHRIDAWLVAPAQRRLDALQQSGTAQLRLGAYGWVDGLAPGLPGPTSAGLLHAPSTGAALAAAVLRDRAVSDPGRWDLDITSRKARIAERLAEHVRVGAHLSEALGREVERIVATTPAIEELRRNFPIRTEHAGKRVCDGLKILTSEPFPVPLDSFQEVALQDLRDGLDAYGDLLVADAVHHLVEGRPEVASAVMSAAAGFSRPPAFSLMKTPREGRTVATSSLLVLAHVESASLPAEDVARALVSPTVTLDPSVADYIVAEAGAAGEWDFDVQLPGAAPPDRLNRTVYLSELGLEPSDALALTWTRLAQLAIEWATGLEGVLPGNSEMSSSVVGGSARSRYEYAARIVGLIGRDPAGSRAMWEDSATDPGSEGVDASLLARYVNAREACAALVRQLRAWVELLATFDPRAGENLETLGRLIRACAAWGIAPDLARPAVQTDHESSSDERLLRRLAQAAPLALASLEQRLADAPDSVAVADLSRAEFLDAAAALVSPTGQVAFTNPISVADLPPVQPADGEGGLDQAWLTVVATVRPRLARLETYQLTSQSPLRPWTNRGSDPWQLDGSDTRRLVVVHAAPRVDFSSLAPGNLVAAAAIDQFSEVIPSAEVATGAAFGFDAPAARAQQAILLAVPPIVDQALDQETLVQIVSETRELAHARMARPVDLDEQYWGLAPTCLLPASGAVATPLEVRL